MNNNYLPIDIQCPVCSERHMIVEEWPLAFYKCGDKVFFAGLGGRCTFPKNGRSGDSEHSQRYVRG